MVSAFLFDLDGTLYGDAGALPGSLELLLTLRQRRIPHRFLTNTTSRSRAGVTDKLRAFGFELEPEELLTPVVAAASTCRALGHRVVAPFVALAALEDLHGLELSGGVATTRTQAPEAVIVGDLGSRWSFALMQEAFEYLTQGASLIAVSRDRYWLREGRLTLDAGAFVAGLEYAAGVEAFVVGKPSPAFFQAAVESLGLPEHTDPGRIVMVGDDIRTDIAGAQAAGHQGWLVRTGKFREADLQSGIVPDRVLEGVEEVLGLLEPG